MNHKTFTHSRQLRAKVEALPNKAKMITEEEKQSFEEKRKAQQAKLLEFLAEIQEEQTEKNDKGKATPLKNTFNKIINNANKI